MSSITQQRKGYGDGRRLKIETDWSRTIEVSRSGERFFLTVEADDLEFERISSVLTEEQAEALADALNEAVVIRNLDREQVKAQRGDIVRIDNPVDYAFWSDGLKEGQIAVASYCSEVGADVRVVGTSIKGALAHDGLTVLERDGEAVNA